MIHRSVILTVLCAFSGACGKDVMLNDAEIEDADIVIRAHLAPDADCKLDKDSRVLSRGQFDIEGEDQSGYDLNLLVDNRTSDNVVFDEAEVTLATPQEQTIVFGTDPPLPNPYVTGAVAPISPEASAVVTVRAIPAAYAFSFGDFVDGELAVTVELHGKTDAGKSVKSRTLKFPVEICGGCLVRCLEDVIDGGMTLDDVYGSECADDACADGRPCVHECGHGR